MTWINFTEAPINPFKLDRIWWEAGICVDKHGWLLKGDEMDSGSMTHYYTHSKEGFPILQEDFNGGEVNPEERKELRLAKENVNRTLYANPEEHVTLQMLFPNPQAGEKIL